MAARLVSSQVISGVSVRMLPSGFVSHQTPALNVVSGIESLGVFLLLLVVSLLCVTEDRVPGPAMVQARKSPQEPDISRVAGIPLVRFRFVVP